MNPTWHQSMMKLKKNISGDREKYVKNNREK